MKRVISLWLPNFATDRLCRLRQDWLDSPLGLVRENRGQQVLYAVNDLARNSGIRAGMTLADAKAILPELQTSEADLAAETLSLHRLADWCNRFSPWTAPDEDGSGIEFAGGGSIWIDITGCAHLFGGEDALLREITTRLSAIGYTSYAAVADTPGGAWASVRHTSYKRRRWVIIRTNRLQDALAPLPVAGLRLSPSTVAGLRAVGLRRIGDLMPLPRAAVADRFGSEVADRIDQALGFRPEPVSPLSPADPWHVRTTFPEPIGRMEDLEEAVRKLAPELASILETDGRGARQLALSFYRPDGNIDRLRAGTSRPSRDAAHFVRLLLPRLDRLEIAFGIDAITLTASTTEKLLPMQTALDRAGKEDSTGIAELADRLSNRLGPGNVVQMTLQESHIPERAVTATPVTARARPVPAASWQSGCLPGRRPLRLLPRPEEVEAIAPVPDEPPVMFRWRKQVFRIEHADGPERIAPEWWNDGLGVLEAERSNADTESDKDIPATAGTVQKNIRDYYRVEDRRGRRFWVYRAGIYSPGDQPQWYVHGIFG